jgi:hypothetical protein
MRRVAAARFSHIDNECLLRSAGEKISDRLATGYRAAVMAGARAPFIEDADAKSGFPPCPFTAP